MLADLWRVARVREPELMDDPSLPLDAHMSALDALARINLLSRTASQIAYAARRLVPQGSTATNRPLRIVDVACGGGDVTLAVARRLSRGRQGTVAMTGIDMSARAIDRARARITANEAETVEFAVRDVVSDGCPPCDVAISSLFLHHLDDATAVGVLRGMAAAADRGIVVSDLVRNAAGLALAVVATTVVCRSRVARVDGPISVRAARTPAECRALCDCAGLAGAALRRSWPQRIMIEWKKDPAGAAAAD